MHTQLSVPTRRTAWLIGGDLIVFIVFAIIGRRSHGSAAGLAAFAEVLATAAPFALGWLLVAPWLGAYRPDVTNQPLTTLRTTALAWALALPVGGALRALAIGRISPPSFYIVTFLALLVLLGLWRVGFAWGYKGRSTSSL
jgi:hypothetical protein